MPLNQGAPGGQLWRVGQTYWLVYTVPGSEPEVPLGFKIGSRSQLNELSDGTPTVDRTVQNTAAASELGFLDVGLVDEVGQFDEDPWDVWVRSYDRQAQALPMLQDPEVMALYASAMLRGANAPTPEELSQTNWWQSRSEREREWATLNLQDPETARRQLADRRRAVDELMRSSGVDASDELLDYMANRWSSGKWTESMTRSQVQALSDPYSGQQLESTVERLARGYDPSGGDRSAFEAGRDSVERRVRAIFDNRGVGYGQHDDRSVTEDGEERIARLTDAVMSGERTLQDVRESVNQIAGLNPTTEVAIAREGEEEVRGLLLDWLGPQIAGQYEGRWMREWAGRLRNDPNAREDLMQELRSLRMGVYPEWANENLRYADVAPTAKALFQQVWQQEPDETDPFFNDILRMTAPGAEGSYAAAERLRREGLERGVEAVNDQMSSGMLQALGGDVRPSMTR